MDPNQILLLLDQLESSGGGMVLKVGDTSKAVVLSMESYIALTSAQSLPPKSAPDTPPSPPLPKYSKVLITGGAGYIGGHITRVFLEAGYELVVLDNLHTGKREHVPANITFIEGDVRDENLLIDIFTNFSIDAVLHLAALLEVEESTKEPAKYLDVNLGGTLALLSAMQKANVGRLIFSSTAAVYGGQSAPLDEEAWVNPSSPYGQSKLLAEKTIEYFASNLGIVATVLRFFNVAGRNPSWPVFDTHHRSHLIPVVLDVASGKQKILTVNGGDYETNDGSCVRDYVHVLDIAKAHRLALEKPQDKNFELYNVGTGRGASVKEAVAVAAEVTGHMIPMEVGSRRAGDDAQTVAKVDKIHSSLGFEASHSALSEIIQSSWEG